MTQRLGFFVALEGIDNVGKTSLLESLSVEFSPRLPVVTTRELTTPVGIFVREGLARSDFGSIGKVLLFAADRQARLDSGFGASLQTRSLCIADRWTLSAAAYRSAENPGLLDYVLQVNSVFPKPDLTILLDATAELSIARGKPINKNNYSLEFLSAVRAQYLLLADRFGFVVVDGTQDFATLAQSVSRVVELALDKRI